MSGRLLLIISVIVAGTIGALAYVLRASAIVPVASIPYALAALGAAVGATAFTREDRMFWAWASIGLGNLIALVGVLALSRPPLHVPIGPPAPDSLHLLIMVIDVLLNVFTVVGIVMFAQAYRSLGPPPGLYRVATVVAFVAGAAMVGPSIVQALRAIAAGGREEWGTIISSAGDLTAITMMGPLAVTALRTRGSPLAWPYLLLTLGVASWLAYDASALLSGDTQMLADLVLAASGLTFTGAAGVAHRTALAT
jgi:hypothetical protein